MKLRYNVVILGGAIVFSLLSSALFAQPKYRTFNQNDLGEKKDKAGKAVGSTACFVFHNTTGQTVN
ncbi:MAG: hypothetical protein HY033_13620, partial [Ignavibacteriae bacterium]|nr:hypothetical protein [Ignavibacteria bacterium]MBI3365931.1 hypothetical protein [Ignavibacteriota bacterium]